MLEYACQVFHRSLPSYLSDEIERIQQRAIQIVFPQCKYSEALERAGIPILSARRRSLCLDHFRNIVRDGNHKLADLLPLKSTHKSQLKSRRDFNIPVCKIDHYKNSLIISHSNNFSSIYFTYLYISKFKCNVSVSYWFILIHVIIFYCI